MPQSKAVAVLFVISLSLIFVGGGSALADELSDVTKQKDTTTKKLSDLSAQKEGLSKKIEELTKNLSATQEDISGLSAKISEMEKRLIEINTALEEKRKELAKKIEIRNSAVRTYYEESAVSALEIFLSSLGTSTATSGFKGLSQSYAAKRTLTANTINAIGILNKDITQYEIDKAAAEKIKADLDSEKAKLVVLKNNLVVEQAEVQQRINSLDDEINKVNATLANLTARQRELLREKFGSTSGGDTIGDEEQAASTLPEPSFRPAYAFFTYGYPHRVGANQYGMYGRAKSGQGYQDILKAYFSNVEVSGSCDKSKTIPVQGYGNLKLEDTYLMGIAEMPESWGSKGGQEALKAQAVLARTYALNYTWYYWDSKSGSLKKRGIPVSICTSQSCQVYSGGKKTGNWKKAVEDTCGKILTYKGSPITAWYASTAGGFTRTSGQVWGSDRPWSKGIRDAKCADVFECSYDGPKFGNSPWFHKAWGTNNSTGNGWMKEAEAEDLFNAYLLSEKSASYNQYLSTPSKGGWSFDKVKQKLEDLGIDPVGAIGDIKMRDDGTGYTTSVVLSSANYSSKTFDGYKFRSIFNLRSPGTLIIWTSFYDVLIKD